jgi:hypothetical protein
MRKSFRVLSGGRGDGPNQRAQLLAHCGMLHMGFVGDNMPANLIVHSVPKASPTRLKKQSALTIDHKQDIFTALINDDADHHLFTSLFNWFLINSDMSIFHRNSKAFANLRYTRNITMNEISALTLVHQYARGAIGRMPTCPTQGRLSSYQNSNIREEHLAWERGKMVSSFLQEKHKELFGGNGPQLTVEFLLNTCLFQKLDDFKKCLKNGIFDPQSDRCHSSLQCTGMYWLHYLKLSQVIEGLADKARKISPLHISEEQEITFNSDDGVLCPIERIWAKRSHDAMAVALSKMKKKTRERPKRKC